MKYTHLQLFWTCLKILIFDNDVDIFSFFFYNLDSEGNVD